ncbi:MAG: NADH-quinone oxidoreductase subunit J [archaeon]|jgi:multisubunit Na+/H+ antiporter MnhB subunit|nr:NADH-quinone oxidoreductase subunit J [Candidatus Bathyarchaeum sp.]
MLFETILAIGMIVSAVLAIYLKETIASVLSLSTLMLLLALLYFNLNAPFAAIFQLALGVGTAAIFLLAGDSLTTKRDEKTSTKTKFLAIIASAILCVPMLVGTIETGSVIESMEISLSQTIWDLRAIDVLAQGIVVLTAAIGVILLLREEWRRK